jgi:hypothetical protein
MEHLYVIFNKSYHYPLLEKAFGMNPLARTFIETIAIWCPEDESQNEVLPSKDVLYKDNGYLSDKYVGRTTFLY